MDLTVKDLNVNLNKKEIIKNVSLKISDNSFVALLGPNGSGKSTLLRSIYRVLKPSGGTILFDGKVSKEISNKKLAKKMSVLSQMNNLNFDFTVKEIVMMGRSPHLNILETEKIKDYEIASLSLENVGMKDYENRSYTSLSGGEKQRIMLARAIAQEPKLLILDEPTNHLDIRFQLQILSIVKKLGINVLAALHDLTLASQFCDYIYILKDGEIDSQGKPDEVLTKETIRRVYDIECEIVQAPNSKGILISYYSPGVL
ncbi:iron complex transport system ATP-binding protein [Tissierella praeacuta]|uniref:ABC transporter ATP-binding protein n=1 Tax=Tissierella praeacuta TaxID=43131 RepID=UPI0010451165|nr:ABC transporter ATP-binding protein [Tissierella praeacuta]TCU66437.1 iron complex transport system ATP-binding protein [Tissierella praeacuta]